MSYIELGGLVLGTGLVAAFTGALLHRIVHHDRFRRYHEVGYAVFVQLGVIFAVPLAFVFNGVWSDYNTASQAIDSECAQPARDCDSKRSSAITKPGMQSWMICAPTSRPFLTENGLTCGGGVSPELLTPRAWLQLRAVVNPLR